MSEFFKEIGKYFLDVSKIVLLVGILTPFFSDKKVPTSAIMIAIVLFLIGAFITYKGVTHGRN